MFIVSMFIYNIFELFIPGQQVYDYYYMN